MIDIFKFLEVVIVVCIMLLCVSIAHSAEIVIRVKIDLPMGTNCELLQDIIIDIPYSEDYGSQLPYVLPKGTIIKVRDEK